MSYHSYNRRMSGRNSTLLVAGGMATFLISSCAIDSGPEEEMVEAEYVQVCQMQGDDGEYYRVEDTRCGTDENGSIPGSFSYMYIGTATDYNVPAHGGKLDKKRVSSHLPAGKTVQINPLPAKGGSLKANASVQRGGLGAGAKGGSAGS